MSINQKEIEYYQDLVKKHYSDNDDSDGSHLKLSGKVVICSKNFQISFYQIRVRTSKEEKKRQEAKERMEKNYANCVEGDWFWEKKEERNTLRLANREANSEKNLISSHKKATSRMKNIITCNAWQWPKKSGLMFPPVFLTLTFKEDVSDPKIANRIFSKFIQRYNYKIFQTKNKVLQYIAVPEFQKSGRIHYHCLFFNLPYNVKNYDIARDVWGNGHVIMKAVYTKTIYGLSNYMSKYLVKALADKRLFHKKKYFPSAKLLRPIILKGYYKSLDILEALQRTRPPEKIINKRFEVDFIGIMNFYFCQLESNETTSDLFPELDQYTQSILQSEINKEQDKLKI